jgi:hypothetical protein
MPPENVRRLVDIEAGLDEGQLSQVRFGRRRFLRNMSVALFGVATGIVATSQEAEARGTPEFCFGARGCNCCATSLAKEKWCCENPTCTAASTNCGGGLCWTTCLGDGRCFECCDYYRHTGEICMCRKQVA